MKKTSIGGSALIEGLMMIGPESAAIAIRKPDGEIIVDLKALPRKDIFTKIPVVRGVVNFFRQIVLVMKALMYSADFVDTEDTEATQSEPSKLDKFLDRILGNKMKEVAIYISVILSIAFSIGLFILLPNLLASFVGFNKKVRSGIIFYNLFEGLLRVTLFFCYIFLSSKMKDIKRVWEYHGAEHKTIHCYEQGDELTVENVKKYSTKHPRCGTSFMFLVMIVSIIVFSFLPVYSQVIFNMLLRLLFIPLVAGISYEILKFAGRSEWSIVKILNAPGMFFQLFTTKEPDAGQIEVAIVAFNNVLVPDKSADNW
jgi:uncharacterized protein YqhQ